MHSRFGSIELQAKIIATYLQQYGDMKMSNESVDQEVQAKGLTYAPRVSLQDVMDNIVGETYTLLPNRRTTICQLTLRNGFTVEGKSACVSIENYNEELGNRRAKENAITEIWQVMGYHLAQEIFEGKYGAQSNAA